MQSQKDGTDIAEGELSAFVSPGAVFGTLVKNVAKKIKEETK